MAEKVRKSEKEDRFEREDADSKIKSLVDVRRVAKVVTGGKRFAFSALVVVGDGRGRVGCGIGKAREVPDAVRKATDQASRSMVKVPLREGRTIHHDVTVSVGATRVHLRTAPSGTGVIAGGAMRYLFEALGVQDVVSKSFGSRTPHNVLAATLKALQSIQPPRAVALRRGKKVAEIFSRKAGEEKA